MRSVFIVVFTFSSLYCFSQDHGIPFGHITYKELDLHIYTSDTTAEALIVHEFGEAYFDNRPNYDLIFEYHVKIKILKKSGLKLADFEIPLIKNKDRFEKIRSIEAASYNVENNSIRAAKVSNKNIFTENRSKHVDVKKFAIPNVRVGSIIEVKYILETPFVYNFRTWSFQSDLPKLSSEYWAAIPGNYVYSIMLKGFLDLQKNEKEVVKDCFSPGGNRADCTLYKFAMKDIPAFEEEDYMVSKSNFISSINFELSEIRYFDGRVDKITKEWKDVEDELKKDLRFGVQVRRGEDIVDAKVKQLIGGDVTTSAKARKIYDFIKDWYEWNEEYSMYSEAGIKKAFERKVGNVADINLSLIAAFRYAGLDAEPVLISTRNNGIPTEIYPVLSDFNYVVARVTIDGKVYLVDATDDFHPFGVLPERCLNGKGRVLGEKESYWMDLKPQVNGTLKNVYKLDLDSTGVMRGYIKQTYIGYEAISIRKKIHAFHNHEEYIKDLKNSLHGVDVKNVVISNVDSLDAEVIQKMDIEMEAFSDPKTHTFLFNPFLLDKWEENPFKSNKRLYPVDFGAPMVISTTIELDYPKEFELVNLPEKIGLSLPNSGGRYLVSATLTNNKLIFTHWITISKTVFTAEEYHYLKELFNKVIQIQNSDLLFKRKD
jgi:hypothetical protein